MTRCQRRRCGKLAVISSGYVNYLRGRTMVGFGRPRKDPRITGSHMLSSTMCAASASATYYLSRLNSPLTQSLCTLRSGRRLAPEKSQAGRRLLSWGGAARPIRPSRNPGAMKPGRSTTCPKNPPKQTCWPHSKSPTFPRNTAATMQLNATTNSRHHGGNAVLSAW